MTFWGYHTLLAVRAYHRLDGSVGILIDPTSDDSHPGALLTGYVRVGRLATTRMFAGGLAW